jgi:hypothetical protein
MTTLTISATGKSTLLRGFPVALNIDKPPDVARIADVKAALVAKVPRVYFSPYMGPWWFFLMSARALQLYVARQKLTLKGETKALDDDATLVAVGVLDGSEVVVKDLGPQISWRTVFLVEYVCLSLTCSTFSLTIMRLGKQNRQVHSSFILFCIICPTCSTEVGCNTANCKSGSSFFLLSLHRS